MPQSVENEKRQLGAMSVLLTLFGVGLVLGGMAFSIISMRRQSDRWLELSSKNKPFVDAFLDSMRKGDFDQARTFLSSNLAVQCDQEKLAKLKTEIESLGPVPFVTGWTLHGGSSGIRFSALGLQVSSEPPILDLRLSFPVSGNEPPTDLSFSLTYEKNRMVLDRIERLPRLSTPPPPTTPAQPGTLPATKRALRGL